MPSAKRVLGGRAEAHAAHYLETLGFRILAANYEVPRMGEIDLVARRADTVYFVEVKARSREDLFGGMEGCISAQKLARIKRCADLFLQQASCRDLYGSFWGAFVHLAPDGSCEKIRLVPLDDAAIFS